MSFEVLEAAISSVLNSSLVSERIEFLWHAGEPLSAGIDFYLRAVELIDRHDHDPSLEIIHTLQTNGTLLDDDWCTFITQNNFRVGISIDGPQFLHDKYRANWSGKGSFANAMRGYMLMKKRSLEVGALCVLTRESLNFPDELYNFFVEKEFGWLGFNVEEIESQNRFSTLDRRTDKRWEDTKQAYRGFISRLFDLWSTDPKRIEIREFSDVLNIISMKFSDPTYHREPVETIPFGIVTIDKNGNVTTFSPEFAGMKRTDNSSFSLGNILEQDLASLERSPGFLITNSEVESSMRMCADTCLYFDFCGGDFLSNKYSENGTLASTETSSCILHRQSLAEVVIEKLTAKSQLNRTASSATYS